MSASVTPSVRVRAMRARDRQVVAGLVAGLTVRQLARLWGLSPARVHQLGAAAGVRRRPRVGPAEASAPCPAPGS